MIQHSEINGGSEPEATAWRVYRSHGQIMINKRTCYFNIILLIMAFNVAVPNNILERIDLKTAPPPTGPIWVFTVDRC